MAIFLGDVVAVDLHVDERHALSPIFAGPRRDVNDGPQTPSGRAPAPAPEHGVDVSELLQLHVPPMFSVRDHDGVGFEIVSKREVLPLRLRVATVST